jgi:hypothetical protein
MAASLPVLKLDERGSPGSTCLGRKSAIGEGDVAVVVRSASGVCCANHMNVRDGVGPAVRRAGPSVRFQPANECPLLARNRHQ